MSKKEKFFKKSMRFLIDNKRYPAFKMLEIENRFGLDTDGDIIPWRKGQRRSADFAGVLVNFAINTKNCSFHEYKVLAKDAQERKTKNIRRREQEVGKYQWPKRARKRTYWNNFLKHDKDLFVTGTQVREGLTK